MMRRKGGKVMRGRQALLGILFSLGSISALGQNPVLSNIETPYPAVQAPVTIAGKTYSAGAV